MKRFYIDTDEKLKEIFTEHCNLSGEQYGEIRAELIYLVADYQEEEPKEEIEKRVNYLKAVSDFLYNTSELTLKEHNALIDLLGEIQTEGDKA